MQRIALIVGVLIGCLGCSVQTPDASFECSDEGAACDDGNPCTVGDACKAGACAPGNPTDFETCCASVGGAVGGACIAHDEAGDWGLVPEGSLWMGCNGALDLSCQPDEAPQHEVQISKPYWIGVHEVTVKAYQTCVEFGGCADPPAAGGQCNWGATGREMHPVNCVTWHQADAFCAWAGGRLPSEAEWELAARGRCEDNPGDDCAAAMRVWPWGHDTPKCGDTSVFDAGAGSGCAQGGTWEVGSGSAEGKSPFGMQDMAGNVWEWTADGYDVDGYAALAETPAIDPMAAVGDDLRVRRGGGFSSVATYTRPGARAGDKASSAAVTLGFRCARSTGP